MGRCQVIKCKRKIKEHFRGLRDGTTGKSVCLAHGHPDSILGIPDDLPSSIRSDS